MKEEKIKLLTDQIINEEEVFFNFLKSKFPLFYKSNLFFRDLEYGIQQFYKKKNVKLSLGEILAVTERTAAYFEEKNYFIRINDGTWMINMPQFVTAGPGDPF